MPDSESNQPVERRRAAPLQVAADMLAQSEHEIEADRLREAHSRKATSSTPATSGASTGSPDRAVADNIESPRKTVANSEEQDSHDDDSSRGRRAAARKARHAAAEKRRVEKAAGKAFTASKRDSVRRSSRSEEGPTLTEKSVAAKVGESVAHMEPPTVEAAEAAANEDERVAAEARWSGFNHGTAAQLAAETSPAGSTFAEKLVAADRETAPAQLATEHTEASERQIAQAENDAQIRVEVALTEAKRLVEQADVDAKRRIAEAIAQAERLTLESKREAQERVRRAVAAARGAVEEKLQEAERAALEWISAAETEADRVAATSIMVANQYSETIPLAQPVPPVDEYVDEKPDDKDSGNPKGVDESWTLAPKIKRVVRKK